jgi:hypothetical protein
MFAILLYVCETGRERYVFALVNRARNGKRLLMKFLIFTRVRSWSDHYAKPNCWAFFCRMALSTDGLFL